MEEDAIMGFFYISLSHMLPLLHGIRTMSEGKRERGAVLLNYYKPVFCYRGVLSEVGRAVD